MIRPIPVIAALTALVACAPSPASRIPLAPPPQPYTGGPLIVGTVGVGPIRAETYFDTGRIARLFPAAKLRKGLIQLDPLDPDDTLRVITIYQGETAVLEIDHGARRARGTGDPLVGQVRAIGGPIVGPHGERLRMSWKDARLDLSQCEVGDKRQKGALVCARPHEGSVTYVFAIPGWDAADLPTPSLLQTTSYLREIVWTPPSTRGPS
jgi:hypothetical protein